MKSKVQLQRLVILGMMALFSIPTRADNPPVVEIDIIIEKEDPMGELPNLIVHLNTSTGQLWVETNVNQWMWVYILDADTGVVYSIDYIDPSLNYGNVYTTNAPSLPGNYCVYFQSGTTIAMGYFTIQ